MNTHYLKIAVFVLPLAAGCQNPLFESAAESPAERNQFADTGELQQQPSQTAPQTSQLINPINRTVKPGTNPSVKTAAGSSGKFNVTKKESKAAVELTKRAHDALQAGNLDEAKSTYKLVLRMQPKNATVHHRLAVIADIQKEYPTAEQHYLSALQANPKDANLMSDIGYSYLLQKRYEESERWLKQSLQIEPAHQLAKNHLGTLYQELRNSQQQDPRMLQQPQNNIQMVNQQQQFSSPPNSMRNGMTPQLQNHRPSNHASPQYNAARQQAIAHSLAQTAAHHQRGTSPDSQINDLFRQIDGQISKPTRTSIHAPNPHRNGFSQSGNIVASPEMLKSKPVQVPVNTPHQFSTTPHQQVSHQVNLPSQQTGMTLPTTKTNARIPEPNPLDSMPSWPPIGSTKSTVASGNRNLPSQNNSLNRAGSQPSPTTTTHNNVGIGQPQLHSNPVARQQPLPQGLLTAGQSPTTMGTVLPNSHQSPNDANARNAVFMGMNVGFSQPFPTTPSASNQLPSQNLQPNQENKTRMHGSQFQQTPRTLRGHQMAGSVQYRDIAPTQYNQPAVNPVQQQPANQLTSQVQQWPSVGNSRNNDAGAAGVQIAPAYSATNQNRVVPANHWNNPTPVQSKASDPLAAYEQQIQQQNAQINNLRSQLQTERNQMQQPYSPGQPFGVTAPVNQHQEIEPAPYHNRALNQSTN